MYCISCGTKLADSQKICPLCGLEVYHPKMKLPAGDPLYPADRHPQKEVSAWGIRVLILAFFLVPLVTVLLCDLPIHGELTWSGYVIGALIISYTAVILPFWFKAPNPVIFIPIDFALIGAYLLYINYAVKGHWFMTFAFPVVGFFALIVTTIVTLTRYVRRGRLYIFGGAIVATGLFIPVIELLMHITFDRVNFTYWSFYPMGALFLFGGFLIFLGICRPAREIMERKFFI